MTQQEEITKARSRVMTNALAFLRAVFWPVRFLWLRGLGSRVDSVKQKMRRLGLVVGTRGTIVPTTTSEIVLP